MDSSVSKSQLRKVLLDYRRILSKEEYARRNDQLCSLLQSHVDLEKYTFIHAFLPIQKNNEPDVQNLFPYFWEKGILTVASKTDFRKKEMHHFEINKSTEIATNERGIPEPNESKEVSLDQVNAILLPLMLADKQGNRIGYGGGYYDRLLEGTKAIKIGLSLSNPVDSILQTNEWDIPLDFLITPFKIYNYGQDHTRRN